MASIFCPHCRTHHDQNVHVGASVAPLRALQPMALRNVEAPTRRTIPIRNAVGVLLTHFGSDSGALLTRDPSTVKFSDPNPLVYLAVMRDSQTYLLVTSIQERKPSFPEAANGIIVAPLYGPKVGSLSVGDPVVILNMAR